MDIYKEWKKLSESKFSNQIKREEVMNAIYQESKSTISELKKRLGYKMNWVLFFALICTAGMIWTINKPQALLIFGVANIIYIASFFGLRFFHKRMDHQLKEDKSLLASLKLNENLLKSSLRLETNVTLISFPIILIGMILLKDVYNGLTILEAISGVNTLIVMVIVLAIGFPFVHFTGAKMNKIAFGAYLNNLRKNINQLEFLN